MSDVIGTNAPERPSRAHRREPRERQEIHRPHERRRQGAVQAQRPDPRPPRRTPLLPGEDPAAFELLREALRDEFQPRSAAEALLVENMAAAQWALDRCRRQEIAVLARRVERAEADHEAARLDGVEQLTWSLRSDPAGALDRLRRSAEGRDWLLGQWRGLREALDRPWNWEHTDKDQAVRLLGRRPEDVFAAEPLAQEVTVCYLALQFTHCAPDQNRIKLRLCHIDSHTVDEAAVAAHAGRLLPLLPSVPEARARLERLIGEEEARIARETADDSAAEPDPADVAARERALDLALFDDTPEGALRLRYVARASERLQPVAPRPAGAAQGPPRRGGVARRRRRGPGRGRPPLDRTVRSRHADRSQSRRRTGARGATGRRDRGSRRGAPADRTQSRRRTGRGRVTHTVTVAGAAAERTQPAGGRVPQGPCRDGAGRHEPAPAPPPVAAFHVPPPAAVWVPRVSGG